MLPTRRDAVLLAMLLLALAGVMVAWLAVDPRPPEWDHANHLERVLECHRILAEPGHARFAEIVAMSRFSLLVDWLVRHLDPTPRLRRPPVTVTLAAPRLLPG